MTNFKLQYRETKWVEAETGIEIAPQDQEKVRRKIWLQEQPKIKHDPLYFCCAICGVALIKRSNTGIDVEDETTLRCFTHHQLDPLEKLLFWQPEIGKLYDSGDLVFELKRECHSREFEWCEKCQGGDCTDEKQFWVLKEAKEEKLFSDQEIINALVSSDEKATKCPSCGEILELYTRDQMYEIWQAGCSYASSYDRGHPNKADDFKNAIQNI